MGWHLSGSTFLLSALGTIFILHKDIGMNNEMLILPYFM